VVVLATVSKNGDKNGKRGYERVPGGRRPFKSLHGMDMDEVGVDTITLTLQILRLRLRLRLGLRAGMNLW